MMTTMHKKFKTLAFAVGLVVCTAFAEEAVVKGVSWVYEVSDGEACIQRINQVCTGNVAIPEKIGKYRVTSIGPEAFNVSPGPSSVKVPVSVTSIGEAAFLGNKNLTAITLPPKLTRLEKDLFIDCSGLSKVKIPPGVRSIGTQAFSGCRSLKAITLPEGLLDIDRQAFRECSGLMSITIPASVTNVGAFAFAKCDKLVKINVAKGSRTYKSVSGALYTKDGTALVEWPAGSPVSAVTVPDGVTSIGRNAFCCSPKIASISVPHSVTNIDVGAFCGCPKLTAVYVEAGDVDRIKAMPAFVGNGPQDDMEKVKVTEKPAAK